MKSIILPSQRLFPHLDGLLEVDFAMVGDEAGLDVSLGETGKVQSRSVRVQSVGGKLAELHRSTVRLPQTCA